MPINADGYGLNEAMVSAIEAIVNAVAPGAAGVQSVGGSTGVVTLKTINGAVLTGTGDIAVASAYAALSDKISVDLPAINTALASALNSKQASLVSGSNIKTINGESVLGSGNITVVGGDGATDFVELDDAATADLPTVNAPLSDALDAKANLYGPVDLGSGAIALTVSSHANRDLRTTSAVDRTVTVNTSGGTIGDLYSIANLGTGNITMPSGFVIAPGEFGCDVWEGSTTFISTVASGEGGAAVPALISGTTAVGDTLTCTPSSGWHGTFQWQADGVDISGETSATYVIEDVETDYRCNFAGVYYTNVITSSPAAGIKVRIDSPLGGIMIETGDGTAGYNYASSTTSCLAGAGECGKSSKKLGSGVDGYIQAIVSGSALGGGVAARLSLVADGADPDFPNPVYGILANAGNYEATSQFGGGTPDNVVAVAAGDWLRCTRTGSTIVAAVSKDSGGSWTTIKTYTGVTTGAMQGHVGVTNHITLNDITSDVMA